MHRTPVNVCSDFKISDPNAVPAIFDMALNTVALPWSDLLYIVCHNVWTIQHFEWILKTVNDGDNLKKLVTDSLHRKCHQHNDYQWQFATNILKLSPSYGYQHHCNCQNLASTAWIIHLPFSSLSTMSSKFNSVSLSEIK